MISLLKTKVIRNPKIISHQFEGRIYLLDSQRNAVRELNKTAGFIWQNTNKNITVAELIKKIEDRFDVPTKKAGEDVIKFVKRYLRAGLLKKA